MRKSAPAERVKEGDEMRHYLLRATYTPEALLALMRNPHSREEAVRELTEGIGGTLEGFWMAQDEENVVAIMRMPDETSSAAMSMVLAAGGAVRHVKIVPLLTGEESVEVMRRAAAASRSYQPPAAWFA